MPFFTVWGFMCSTELRTNQLDIIVDMSCVRVACNII